MRWFQSKRGDLGTKFHRTKLHLIALRKLITVTILFICTYLSIIT